MQDLRTGAMVELNPETLAGIQKADRTFKQRIAELMRDPTFRQKTGELAGIPA